MTRIPCNHLKGDPNSAECPNCGDAFHRVIPQGVDTSTIREGDEVFISMKEPSLVNGGDLIGTVTQITESTISLAGDTFRLDELSHLEIYQD